MNERIFKSALLGHLLFALIVPERSFSQALRSSEPLSAFDPYLEIIKNYLIVGDFFLKEPKRPLKKNLFWNYPIHLPAPHFQLDFDISSLPSVQGNGRAVEHLNRGAYYYSQGEWMEARNSFLSAQHKYGAGFEYHRRSDVYLALTFFKIAEKLMQVGSFDEVAIKTNLSNGAMFLSRALNEKREFKDEWIDKTMVSRLFYNLAAIYFRYNRYAGAYSAAEEGLARAGLNKENDSALTGMRRILAESYIKNQDYFLASRVFDDALRKTNVRRDAAQIFARLGDIYLSLFNYELAEEAYRYSIVISGTERILDLKQMVLYGETLFWLGKNKEARENFNYVIDRFTEVEHYPDLDEDLLGLAYLRRADTFLLEDDIPQASLNYFRTQREVKPSVWTKTATVRLSCLDLPVFGGNNVMHARNVLSQLKKDNDIGPEALHLAWACETVSYTQREKNTSMVDRVRDFHKLYPESSYLLEMEPPVREVQGEKVWEYFDNNQTREGVLFFEKTRDVLYSDPSPRLRATLFFAYVSLNRGKDAVPFFDESFIERFSEETQLLQMATFLAETAFDSTGVLNKKIAAELFKREGFLSNKSDDILNYFMRIRLSPNYKYHQLWMHKASHGWVSGDLKELCGWSFNFLADVYKQGGNEDYVKRHLVYVIDSYFPQLLRFDEPCGLAYLEREMEIESKVPVKLALRYLSRMDWVLTNSLTTLFWKAAEILYKNGESRSARTLYRHILDRSPPDSYERQFINIRLDDSTTLLENIW